MVVLKHYRMPLNVVACPLTLFSSSREFVGGIADAMESTKPQTVSSAQGEFPARSSYTAYSQIRPSPPARCSHRRAHRGMRRSLRDAANSCGPASP